MYVYIYIYVCVCVFVYIHGIVFIIYSLSCWPHHGLSTLDLWSAPRAPWALPPGSRQADLTGVRRKIFWAG